MNPIENLWGILVRRADAENKQFQAIEELRVAVLRAGVVSKKISLFAWRAVCQTVPLSWLRVKEAPPVIRIFVANYYVELPLNK